MGGFLSSLGNAFGMGSGSNAGGNLGTAIGLPKGFGTSVAGLGSDIANIGNASAGIIPQGKQTGVVPMQASPTQIQAAVNTAGAQPVATQASPQSTTTIPLQQLPQGVTYPITNPGIATTGTTPQLDANGVPTGTIKGGDLNSVYGVDTGTALTDLYNEEGTGAGSTAQAIINANAPNVAQGAATLNTELAAGGISPSSSVSAIENANYESGVQQQNLSTEAQVALQEQQMQQNLLENLLPNQQQRQTDSSGWSIFGDILQGAGDIFGL